MKSHNNDNFIWIRNESGRHFTSGRSFRYSMLRVSLIICAVACMAIGTPAQSGRPKDLFAAAATTSYLRLDPTFNTIGYRSEAFDTLRGMAADMVLQPDGKIVAAGRAGNNRFGLMRFNANGSLDGSFDFDGKTTMEFPSGSSATVTSLLLLPDGKIVAGGYGKTPSGQGEEFILVRYNSDGSVDPSFGGTNGVVSLGFFSGDDPLLKLARRPDGRMIAAGWARTEAGGNDFAIASFNADGTLDTSFGGGKVTANINASNVLASLAIQPDGKIVAGGYTVASDSREFALLRFNLNGTLDTSFDGDGKVSTRFLSGDQTISDIALQPDGKILAVGSAGTSLSEFNFLIARYNSDGSLDTSFSGDGYVMTSFPMTRNSAATRVLLSPDGRIMVGGNAAFGEYHPFALSNQILAFARYNADGSLDRSFDGDGRATTNFITPSEMMANFAFDAQGRIVALANIQITGVSFQFGVMRATVGPEREFSTLFDLSGDRLTDISVFRPSDNTWYTQNAAFYSTRQFGQAGDKITPEDFDGDGITDIAVFRPSTGEWFILGSAAQTFGSTSWGQSGDIPLAADMNGDGIGDLAIFRPSESKWYVRTLDYVVDTVQLGSATDKPVKGDFDGDGTYDLALYDPSSHIWRIKTWSGNTVATTWGEDGDVAVPADYDGDNVTDIAVWRPSTARWYIIGSTAGWMIWRTWGQAGDIPVPADYDGDRRADVAVFRPSNGTWYIVNTSNESINIRTFGQDGDIPVPSAFVY